MTDVSKGQVAFDLSHGTQKTLTVPVGTTMIIAEDAGRYTAEIAQGSIEGELVGKTYTMIVPSEDGSVTYKNTISAAKLRIYKTGDDAENGLAGAEFSLVRTESRDDFTDYESMISMDDTDGTEYLGYLPSGDSEDLSLFTLPDGSYTLTEKEAPQYYDGLSSAVTITADAGVITVSAAPEDESALSLSEPDDNGVYTLTVTNTKKTATVTVIKNVTGTDADKDAEYTFTAKGLTQENDTFILYGRQVPENPGEGEDLSQENTKVYEDIPYGTVFSVLEETYEDFDTTIVISNEAEPVTDIRTATGDITVDGDITITYTNKRNKQPVVIYKTGLGENETITTGASFVVYKASEYDDATQTANAGATIVAQGTTNENGILILGKLPIENGEVFTEYRLVETNAPAGYILPDYLMKIFVYPDKVIGMQATGNMLVKDAEDYDDVSDKTTTVLRVWNNPGVELPSTGGLGTTQIYLLGIMLTGIASIGLVMRKRRRA